MISLARLRVVRVIAVVVGLPALGWAQQEQRRSVPPAAPQRPVTTEYHGVKVTEEYRWLEDWDDADVRAWSEAHNAYARSVLDELPHAAAGADGGVVSGPRPRISGRDCAGYQSAVLVVNLCNIRLYRVR